METPGCPDSVYQLSPPHARKGKRGKQPGAALRQFFLSCLVRGTRGAILRILFQCFTINLHQIGSVERGMQNRPGN